MLTLERLAIVMDDFRLEADLSVRKGARVAILGPSGAGKSTLLAALAGFVRPSAGRILWQGEDITARSPQRRPVAIIFQEHNLFPHMTAAQNVALGLRPSGKLSSAEQRRVEAALAQVGLDGLGGRKPGALSGGQQGRVALARLMLQSRPLILLDEPFAALGPALRASMLDLVGEIAEASGATVLMVTHAPQDALRFAPDTILVEEGRASGPVPTAPLLADPPEGLRAYLGQAPSV